MSAPGFTISGEEQHMWIATEEAVWVPSECIVDEVVVLNSADLSENDIKEISSKGFAKGSAVEPESKLATTWGKLKIR